MMDKIVKEAEPTGPTPSASAPKSVQVTIVNERGLHARASAKFVKCAEAFDADISVTCKDTCVPGTSIMGLMMLGACKGTQISIQAHGPQQCEALSALEKLVTDKFGED